MKFIKLLKSLNRKIDRYDTLSHTNPFTIPRYHYTIVWVEDKVKDNNFFPLNDIE